MTDQNDDKRTPTPEPTRKSPVNKPPSSSGASTWAQGRKLNHVELGFDSGLEYLDLHNADNLKLVPAYEESPFPYLQELNKSYNSGFNAANSSFSTACDIHDNKSDTEVELDIQNARHCRPRIRRRRRLTRNPNDISLAQKLIIYRNVMAYKESL